MNHNKSEEDKTMDLLKKAECSDLDAMTTVAHGYYSGENGLQQHDALAFYWSKRAVDEYPSEAEAAWNLLGNCYQFGVGTEVNTPLAIAAFQKSAEMGNTSAMYNLAEVYHYDAVESQKNACIFWLKRASALGHTYATGMLGHFYTKGQYVKKDIEKGIQLLEKASDAGDSQATRLLAELYWSGEDVPENIPKANYYWTTAVKSGEDNIKAVYYAGLAWFYGVGVERDFKQARNCFEQTDLAEGNAILGSMLFEGVGGSVDRVEGENRLRKAIKYGDSKISLEAMNNLGMYLYSASERLQEAIQLFRDAADRGNANAQVNLGKAYFEGKGVLQNEETAAHYFGLAAKQGNQIAINNLNEMGKAFKQTTNESSCKNHGVTRKKNIWQRIGALKG